MSASKRSSYIKITTARVGEYILPCISFEGEPQENTLLDLLSGSVDIITGTPFGNQVNLLWVKTWEVINKYQWGMALLDDKQVGDKNKIGMGWIITEGIVNILFSINPAVSSFYLNIKDVSDKSNGQKYQTRKIRVGNSVYHSTVDFLDINGKRVSKEGFRRLQK